MTGATYLYAVCRTADARVLRELPGVLPGRPVRTLPAGGLTAVVQSLPAQDGTQEAWQRRLGDAGEVERCALAHHAVVCAVAAAGPVAPLALATVYAGDERAAAAVAGEGERFRAALDRVAGHAEWGVKVYAPAVRREPVTGDAGGPVRDGRDYLARRRAAYRERDRRWADAAGAADAVVRELSGVTSAVRRLRPHDAADGGGPGQVLNAACLVACGTEAGLTAAVERARRSLGARIEVTGPWVPYSFAGADAGGGADTSAGAGAGADGAGAGVSAGAGAGQGGSP